MDDLLTLHRHGLFLRQEALAAGYEDNDLRAALRERVLVRVRHGAYVGADTWHDGDDLWRFRLRGQAVQLRHGERVMLSHTSAAAEHGVSLWRPDLERVHVVRLDGLSGGQSKDVVYHEGPGLAAHAQPLGAGLGLEPVRSCLGAAALHGIEAGVVAIDSMFHLGLGDPEQVAAAYRERARTPHSRPLQIVARLAREGAQSPGESRTRYAFFRQHLPAPVLQYEVRDHHGRLVGTTDFAWPQYRLLGEFDGRIKYGRLLRPGQDVSEVVYAEKVREDALREATGFGMIRYTWADLSAPDRLAARTRRMLATYAAQRGDHFPG